MHLHHAAGRECRGGRTRLNAGRGLRVILREGTTHFLFVSRALLGIVMCRTCRFIADVQQRPQRVVGYVSPLQSSHDTPRPGGGAGGGQTVSYLTKPLPIKCGSSGAPPGPPPSSWKTGGACGLAFLALSDLISSETHSANRASNSESEDDEGDRFRGSIVQESYSALASDNNDSLSWMFDVLLVKEEEHGREHSSCMSTRHRRGGNDDDTCSTSSSVLLQTPTAKITQNEMETSTTTAPTPELEQHHHYQHRTLMAKVPPPEPGVNHLELLLPAPQHLDGVYKREETINSVVRERSIKQRTHLLLNLANVVRSGTPLPPAVPLGTSAGATSEERSAATTTNNRLSQQQHGQQVMPTPKKNTMTEEVCRIRHLTRAAVIDELLVRASHCNMKELDTILTAFVSTCAKSLSTVHLRQFLYILSSVPKHRLFNWLSGQTDLPSRKLCPLNSFDVHGPASVDPTEWDTEFVAGQMLLSYLNVNHPRLHRFEQRPLPNSCSAASCRVARSSSWSSGKSTCHHGRYRRFDAAATRPAPAALSVEGVAAAAL